MVFIFPLMMLVLYGFGIRYDVKSVPMTVLDQEAHRIAAIHRTVRASPYFAIKRYVDNYRDLQSDIDRGDRPSDWSSPRISAEAWLAPRSHSSGDRRRRRQQHRDHRDELRVPITREYSSAIMMSRWKPCCARRI